MNQPLYQGHVSASYVNLLFDWLEAAHPGLLTDLPHDRPAAGELNRISVNQWAGMLAWVDSALQLPDLPLQVASMVKPSNTGLLGYIASCCSTLGEAFARLQQFEHLIYAVNQLDVVLNQDEVILRWGDERGRPGHLVDTTAIGVLVAFSRTLTDQTLNPRRVQFINPMVKSIQPYSEFFHCPVYFEARWTEVVFSADALNWPLRAPDAVMRQILDQQAELLLKRVSTERSPWPLLDRAIQETLAAGSAQVHEVAQRLNLSSRTLQRRLLDMGTSFRQELERVRLAMAKNLLKQGEISLVDLASFLAYNDQSAFTHAFKRLVGETPAKYRKRRQQFGSE